MLGVVGFGALQVKQIVPLTTAVLYVDSLEWFL